MTVRKGGKKLVSILPQPHVSSSWNLKIDKRKERGWRVEQQLWYWCQFLGERRKELNKLLRAGAKIAIVAFMMESMPLFVDLPAFLTAELSKLKVPIRMIIYDKDGPPIREMRSSRLKRRATTTARTK